MPKATWSSFKLESLTEQDRPITYGVVKPGDSDDTNGILFVRGGDIYNGKIALDRLRTITKKISDVYKRTLLTGGELLISLVGNPGEVAIAPLSLKGANIARQVGMIALRADVWTPYVMYYLMSPSGKAKLSAQRTGSVQTVINLTELRKVQILLPPFPIQRRIADILSAYDDLIENNMRRIRILEQVAQAIYQEWFGKVNKESLPKGWELVTVRDVSTYINRGVSPKYDDNSASTVINQKCIRNERLNLGLARRHSTKLHQDKYVRFGDVLVNSTGIGTLGRVAQVYQEIPDCTVDSHVSIVRPNEKVSIDYYGFYLLTLQPVFDSLGTGSTGQTELARDTIANADFILPPKNLQDKFSEIISPLRKQTNILTAKNANLRQTRDLLLPRLVSGEIEV